MDYGFLLLNAITNSLLHFLVKFPRQGIHRLWSATFHASQSQTVYYNFSFEVSPNTSFSDGNHTYPRGGGKGFLDSKGTCGCAARKDILFRTSSLAKGVLFSNFSRVKSRQGYAFWQFWSKKCQNSVIFVKKSNFLKILVQKMRKFGKYCLETPIQSTFEGKISLAKGIIFTKIGLANGHILKLWAAPYPKFSREPPTPPPCTYLSYKFWFPVIASSRRRLI